MGARHPFHTYVHTNIIKFLEGFRYDAHPMGMLLGAVGALSTFYPDAKDVHDPANRYIQRVRLMAKMPTIAAFCFRHTRGLPYEFPRNDLDYIGNFVNMTFSIGGQHQPNPVLQRALEILLHPARRPRAELLHQRGPRRRLVRRGPLLGGVRRASPRSTARCTAAPTRPSCTMLDEIGDKKNIPAFIEQVKAGRGPADGLRAPGLQVATTRGPS